MFQHLLTFLFAITLVGGLAAQPANDDCANAIAVSLDEEVTFSTVGATDVGPNVAGCGGFTPAENDSIPADIWFTFTASADATLQWSNCGAGSFDSRMAVYAVANACNASNDNLVNCNDDDLNCADATSLVTFVATAGQTYALRIGGFANEDIPATSGQGAVTLTAISVPDNDACSNAIPVTIGENQTFTTINATTDGPDHANNSSCFGFGSATAVQDIWYSFTPDFEGTVEWSTCGSVDFDTRLAVYLPGTTCPGENLDLYVCNDDDGCGVASRVFFDVDAGDTYLLRLGGYFQDPAGSGTFDLISNDRPESPANDPCESPAEAVLITEEAADNGDFSAIGTTIGATFIIEDYIYPACNSNNNPNAGSFNDVWYTVQTLGNESIELRIVPTGTGSELASGLLVDAFGSCDMLLDTLSFPGGCLYYTGEGETSTITNLPNEDVPLYIRVSTSLTYDSPGPFGLQLVAGVVSNVNNYTFAKQLEVFPNPTSDQLNVRFGLAETTTIQADVFDLLGRRVITQRPGQLASGTQQFTLPTADLAAGIYHLRLTDGTAQQQVKFVVQ